MTKHPTAGMALRPDEGGCVTKRFVIFTRPGWAPEKKGGWLKDEHLIDFLREVVLHDGWKPGFRATVLELTWNNDLWASEAVAYLWEHDAAIGPHRARKAWKEAREKHERIYKTAPKAKLGEEVAEFRKITDARPSAGNDLLAFLAAYDVMPSLERNRRWPHLVRGRAPNEHWPEVMKRLAIEARAVLSAQPASPSEGEDEDLDLYDDKVQEAISWTMRQWGEALGLKTWTQGDGSETVEGDVGAEIINILTDAGLYDPEDGTFAKLTHLASDQSDTEKMRAAANALVNEFAWSAVKADCEESRINLQGLIDSLRSSLKESS